MKKYKNEIGYKLGPLRRKHQDHVCSTVLACFIFETSRAQFLIHNYDDDIGLTVFFIQSCAASAQDALRFGVCGSRPTLLVLLDIHETP